MGAVKEILGSLNLFLSYIIYTILYIQSTSFLRYTLPMKTFSEKVVELALSIPPGRAVTYGMLAHRAGGGAMASQSITTILGKAYMAGQRNIPWHRIVYAGGRVWIDEQHFAGRMNLYKKEKITIIDKNGKYFIQDFDEVVWDFK
jgi:alkylated DNA nucleotide flippase Atl1